MVKTNEEYLYFDLYKNDSDMSEIQFIVSKLKGVTILFIDAFLRYGQTARNREIVTL